MTISPGSRLKRPPVERKPRGACTGEVRRPDGTVNPCILDLHRETDWHRDERSVNALVEVQAAVQRIRQDHPGEPAVQRELIHLVWSGGQKPRWLQKEEAERALR